MFEDRDPFFDEENQKKLIEQIQTAPDCKIYGVSKFNQRTIKGSMVISLLLPIVFTGIAVVFYHPILTFIFPAIVGLATLIALAILSYLNFAHNHYTTFVSELGIAKKSVWDDVAIPWEKIEYIEMKLKGDGFELVVFRSGAKTLGYRNSHFATRLSLKIIGEYIGGIDNWHIIDELSEFAETTKSDRFYVRPDIDKSEGQKKLADILLKEWIGEQDYDADQTQERVSAKSDDELYKLIMDDPQCECLLDAGNFSRILNKNSVTILMAIIAILATFYAMSGGPFASLSVIISVVLFCLIFYGFLKSDEKLIMSPLGVARYYITRPVAIEWQHVESIDFHTKEDKIIAFEFFGNKRRVFCPEHIYKDLLPIELIRKYISELDKWSKMKRNDWEDGVFRLVRPNE